MNFQQPYSQEMDQEFSPSVVQQEFFPRFPQGLWITMCIVCRQTARTRRRIGSRSQEGALVRIIRVQIQGVEKVSSRRGRQRHVLAAGAGPLWTETRAGFHGQPLKFTGKTGDKSRVAEGPFSRIP